jgi:hypothetical protein
VFVVFVLFFKIESDASKAPEPIAVSKPQAAPLEIVATEGSTLTLPPGMAATPAQAAAAAAGAGADSRDESAAAGKGAFSGGKDAAAAVEELARAMAAASASSSSSSASAAAPPVKAPTTDANGAPLKVCAFCNEGIRSAFVMAKGQAFHPNHFQVSDRRTHKFTRLHTQGKDLFWPLNC